MKTNRTIAHKYLQKVITESGSAYKLAQMTGIATTNFYYWLKKKIEEGEDLIDDIEHVISIKNVSKFKTIHLKLKPSLKKL